MLASRATALVFDPMFFQTTIGFSLGCRTLCNQKYRGRLPLNDDFALLKLLPEVRAKQDRAIKQG